MQQISVGLGQINIVTSPVQYIQCLNCLNISKLSKLYLHVSLQAYLQDLPFKAHVKLQFIDCKKP